MIKSLIVGICLLLPTLSNSQIIQHQISDDGYARVPLQFPFPYHGRVFTESYMFSNGVVGFLNPTNSWCCTGFNLETARGSPFDFAIMPLQTDLLNYQGRFLTEGTAQYQRYAWENISEYGVPGNLNTFGLEIRPSGYIGMHYEQVNISPWRPVTIGMTGDTSVGEFTQRYHGPGFSSTEIVSYITQSTGDRCLSDPLSSISCPGYAQAYLVQQCSLNSLYDSSCPGYAEAYFNQQCSNNSLYDRRCPGYETAYALANVVSTPTAVVSAPVLQVSSTGTVSVETPVVSDPIVNEVITRPVNNNATNTTSNIQTNTPTQQTEQKAEKKQDAKPTTTVKKPTQTNEVTASAPVLVDIPQPIAPVLLVDLMYKKLIKKPIQDNNRAYYALIMGSQKSHETMIESQYGR
jgi:hypothetical protein